MSDVENGREIEKEFFEERLVQEMRGRPERLQRLQEKVETLFPGEQLASLRQKIQESFNVPQWGRHHNEGMYMDTHLARMFDVLKEAQCGEIQKELPDDIRRLIVRIVNKHYAELQQYVLLHDISKPDCLTVKYADGREITPTWEEWCALLPGKLRTSSDPKALAEFCTKEGIVAISYYQGSEEGGKRGKNHGVEGATLLRHVSGMTISPEVLFAIQHHETAYTMGSRQESQRGAMFVSYEKHFGQQDSVHQDVALIANYLDAMASLKENGKPHQEDFLLLAGMKYNFDIVQDLRVHIELTALQANGELDPKKVANVIQEIIKRRDRLPSSREQTIEKIKRECRPTQYNRKKLDEQLQEKCVNTGILTTDVKDEILVVVMAGADLGGVASIVQRHLGQGNATNTLMGVMRAILAECEEK